MHQNRSISLFSTPFGHFHFHPFPALICRVDLRRCHYQHHHHCHGDHKHVHQHDHNHHHFHSHHHSHHHHYHDHRRREELKQLSRDRREQMYVWIRITRCFFIVSTMILKLVLFIITVFIIIIVSFFIMMIRSSNNIWLWLPNLPNSKSWGNPSTMSDLAGFHLVRFPNSPNRGNLIRFHHPWWSLWERQTLIHWRQCQ